MKATIQSAHLHFFSLPDSLNQMRKQLDIPLTVIMTIILSFTMLWPLERPLPMIGGADRVVHFITFAALVFPLARTGRFGLLPLFISASAFGGTLELIQPRFNRGADINDWLMDIMGVIFGIACGLIYRHLRKH